MSANNADTTGTPSPATFGEPWPEFNDGLTYRDLVRSPDSGLTLIEFYSTRHQSSAPLLGWLQRIENGQITVNGTIVADPKTVLRTGTELVYHRLPWKEPYAPHLLEVLFEDDHLLGSDTCRPGPLVVNALTFIHILREQGFESGLKESDGSLTITLSTQQIVPYSPTEILGYINRKGPQIALNKPSGLQVLPGGLFQQRTVLTQLQWRIRNQGSVLTDQELCPVPVHRLGRGTSGILLCAKTKLAKTRLAALFADKTSAVASNRKINMGANNGKMSKIYRALACGIINEDEVVIEQPIGTLKYPGVAKGLYVAATSGKPALSKVRVLKRDVQNNLTVVQVEIQSGRPHQIRIHLSFIGHPLIGDPLYVPGGRPKCSAPETIVETFAEDGGYHRPANPVPGDCGYYLHAYHLVLSHPMTNEVFKITAPLPPVFLSHELGE